MFNVDKKINIYKWYIPSETILSMELHNVYNSYMLTLSDFDIVRLYQTDKAYPIRIFQFNSSILSFGFFYLNDGDDKAR